MRCDSEAGLHRQDALQHPGLEVAGTVHADSKWHQGGLAHWQGIPARGKIAMFAEVEAEDRAKNPTPDVEEAHFSRARGGFKFSRESVNRDQQPRVPDSQPPHPVSGPIAYYSIGHGVGVGFLTEGVVGSLDGQREVQITPVPERHGQSEFLEGHMLVRYVICDLPQAVVDVRRSDDIPVDLREPDSDVVRPPHIDYGLWKITDDIADQHVTLEELRLPVPL
ncbi:hypothetical protein E4U14_006431 [Claviceps sp. LM454 group G7]|nr:hypothetical protein E4U14_006431 [Claviceps sp. LM454 group G7]